MNENILNNIDKLINNKKINQAQTELSKLGTEFLKTWPTALSSVISPTGVEVP